MHCVDDEVCSIWGSNSIIEGKHVMGGQITWLVMRRRMAVGIPSGLCFDLSRREVVFNGRRKIVLADLVKDKVEVY